MNRFSCDAFQRAYGTRRSLCNRLRSFGSSEPPREFSLRCVDRSSGAPCQIEGASFLSSGARNLCNPSLICTDQISPERSSFSLRFCEGNDRRGGHHEGIIYLTDIQCELTNESAFNSVFLRRTSPPSFFGSRRPPPPPCLNRAPGPGLRRFLSRFLWGFGGSCGRWRPGLFAGEVFLMHTRVFIACNHHSSGASICREIFGRVLSVSGIQNPPFLAESNTLKMSNRATLVLISGVSRRFFPWRNWDAQCCSRS
jgi:hypothetical protein